MKTKKLVSAICTFALMPMAWAEKGALAPKPVPTIPEPPPLYLNPGAGPAQPTVRPGYVYDQRAQPGRPGLVTAEQAQKILDQFRAVYPKMGSPRFLVYVNRELIHDVSGLKLTHRSEQATAESLDVSGATNKPARVHTVVSNQYQAGTRSEPALADRQTVRDVERLFGRPLRQAGASLTDQKVAADLIADKAIGEFIGASDSPQARKSREAIQKIADAVIEVLISSKNVTVPTIAGSEVLTIPDIQATAIRVADAKILAQAASSDVLRRVPPAAQGGFDVAEVTEATALALMEDMIQAP